MSRKYCENCRQPHDNGATGFCDGCLAQDELDRLEYERDRRHAKDHFMNLSEDERWEMVFDALWANPETRDWLG